MLDARTHYLAIRKLNTLSLPTRNGRHAEACRHVAHERALMTPMIRTRSDLCRASASKYARASARMMPSEMRWAWCDMYEMGRGHVYFVRSVPARAVLELRWRAASAGGEKPPPSGSWMMISTSFFLLTRAST